MEAEATIRYGRTVSNKVSRAKRKDLRSRGQLSPVVRVVEERRATERRAIEEETSERVHAAREEIAEESEAPRATEKKKPRRDLTVLLLAGLIALTGLIFWLTQRSPTKETKIDAVPRLDAPMAGEPVKPSLAALPVMTVPLAITPAPKPTPTAAPALTAAPTAAPALTATPTAAPAPTPTAAPEKPRDRPAEKRAPRPDKPKAQPKPAGASSDPYG